MALVLSGCAGPSDASSSDAPKAGSAATASAAKSAAASAATETSSDSQTTPARRVDSDSPVGLAVMTYNVLAGTPPADWYPYIDEAELEPMARAPGAVELVRGADPDIVGFQEFWWDGAAGAYFREQLADYTWVRLGHGNPIAVRTSRFEVLDSGQELISGEDSDGEGGGRRSHCEGRGWSRWRRRCRRRGCNGWRSLRR
ncbi:MAG: hypothetical protein LBR32_10100 [Propionibacteriaceae bacterium]|nr:hypothetical protein [Propionibacteriaceae bacterium]